MTRLHFMIPLLAATLLFAASPARAETAADTAAPAQASAPKPPARPSENWTVRCDEPKEGEKGGKGYCEVFQRLVIKENSQRFSEMAIGYPAGEKKGVARAVLVLPLGVLLEDPIAIEIDGKQAVKAPVRYCQAQGCFLTFPIKESVMGKMTGGKALMIKAKAFTGQNLHIEMSLQGLASAIRKVAPQS